MTGYLTRRFLLSLMTLLIISAIVYGAVRFLPGGPTWGEDPVNRPMVEAWMQTHHIDEPVIPGYLRWLGTMIRFDMGTSIAVKPGTPVTTLIGGALPYTLLLGSLAFVLTMVTAIPLGLLGAWKPGSIVTRIAAGFLYALHALPVFWIALILQQVITGRLRWLPLLGPGPIGAGSEAARASLVANAGYWVLPTLSLTLGWLAYVTFFSRTTLLESSIDPAARAARARGAGDTRVLVRHGLARAAVPIVSLASLLLPGLMAGSVLIETIFALPGLGRLFFLAASRRDYPVIMGLSLLAATTTLLANFAADLIYRIVDPRVLEREKGDLDP